MQNDSKSFFIVAALSASVSAALVSTVASVYSVTETRKIVAELSATTRSAQRIQEQIASVGLSIQKPAPQAFVQPERDDVPAPLPRHVQPLDIKVPAARPLAERRSEPAEEGGDIPENGKFTLITDEQKPGRGDQPKLKLMGDK